MAPNDAILGCPMSHRKQPDPSGEGVNLSLIITPMLEMSFELRAFFILTSAPSALEGQLAGLQIYASNKAAAAVRTEMRVPRTGKRRKPVPKYQSKKDKKLKWTGRSLLPMWMREEMKGTELIKEDFAIK